MIKRKHITISAISLIVLVSTVLIIIKVYPKNTRSWGDTIDSFNGVAVYYNGKVSTVKGRHLTSDGYNLGKKYQCVEFIKRYYYQRFNHKMPNSYGHAKHFYNPKITSGMINPERALLQFANHTEYKPQTEDIIIFDGTLSNPYGHVAIISQVNEHSIEIIQQNSGRFGSSREILPLNYQNNNWSIQNSRILGFLRKP